jgi:hypothetical protein
LLERESDDVGVPNEVASVVGSDGTRSLTRDQWVDPARSS